MSIGFIMFGKAMIVALWIAITERWATFRQRRREQGLSLRYSRKRNAYVVSDWTAHVDHAALILKRVFLTLLFAWWAFLAVWLSSR